MEALRLKATASEGKLSISVPEEYNNQELEVIVLMTTELSPEVKTPTTKSDRLAIIGKAPYPDFPISKYDVYNQ